MISVIMGGVRTIVKPLGDLATFMWLMLRPDGDLAVINAGQAWFAIMQQRFWHRIPSDCKVVAHPILERTIYP